MTFDHPAWLWLLPLALLPLLARAARPLANPWFAFTARDRASDALQGALVAAGVLALAAIVVGVAGPYRPEVQVERVGTGAEIVLVLDRSRSMDQGFGGQRAGGGAPRGTGPEALDYYTSLRNARDRESKGNVARRILSEFTAKRPLDRFGMVAFSTLPLRVLDFTQKAEVIQAAISAGNIGRGLSETNIGLALQSALSFFDDQPYTGSRIVMLVSDGGDRLDTDARDSIAAQARKLRVAIYWIYIRSSQSPGLQLDRNVPEAEADAQPEAFLHRFFESLGTPYRAYEAENPESLQRALDDVNRLENLPLTYLDTLPRRDLSVWCYAVALAGVALLLAARLAQIGPLAAPADGRTGAAGAGP